MSHVPHTNLYRLLLLGGMTIGISFFACNKDPEITTDGLIPMPGRNITFQIPEGWPQPVYNFQNNPLTQEGFELGRKLFYDPRLSRNNTISCGSCHQPFSAFAHLGHPVSHGIGNLLGTRNSTPIFNLSWHPSFFWDGGVNHIENQPVVPIQNPVEMDEKLENILTKLTDEADYRKRFSDAFGDETVTTQRIFRALAQFMGTMVSANAKYDKYTRNEPGGSMSASELNGLQIFRTNCAGCHTEPLFTDLSFRNNGLSPTAVNDSGRAHITLKPEDLYTFKVPSLRNLKYTPPYMHDGRLNTLEEVLDHYDAGINTNMPNLDPALKNGIRLSPQERTDLITFLNTLNDEAFTKDARFQEQ